MKTAFHTAEFHAGPTKVFCRCACVRLFALLTLALLGTATARAGVTAKLGTTSLTVGPAAGSSSVVLAISPSTGAWTATNNVTWLQLNPTNRSGVGSTNVIFTFTANTGDTRAGTLTIAGLALTVTQAGSGFVPAQPVTALIPSGLEGAEGVAVDTAGNVYVADGYHNAIKEWLVASNTVITLYTNGLNFPEGIAVDAAGNVYFADNGNNMIKEWVAASKSITNLVTNGLSNPFGVAVDTASNVFIVDAGHNSIKEWVAASSNIITVYSNGTTLNYPQGLAVDIADNLYIADHTNKAIKELPAGSSNLTTLVSLNTGPEGVAVDGSGNVYFAATSDQEIQKWTAASGTTNTLVASNLSLPSGVAVDSLGNVYFANFTGSNVLEQPAAFVNTNELSLSTVAGFVQQQVLLPRNENLLAPFAPTTDDSSVAILSDAEGNLTAWVSENEGGNQGARISVFDAVMPLVVGTTGLGTNNSDSFGGAPVQGTNNSEITVSPNGQFLSVYNPGLNATFRYIIPESAMLGSCADAPPVTNWGIEWMPLDPDKSGNQLPDGAYVQVQTIITGDNPLATITLIKEDNTTNTLLAATFPDNVTSFTAIKYGGTNPLSSRQFDLPNGTNVAYIWPSGNDIASGQAVVLPVQGVELYSNWYVEPFWTPRMVSFDSSGEDQEMCDGVLIYPNIPVQTNVTNVTYVASQNTLITVTNIVVEPLWICYSVSNGVSQDVLELSWFGSGVLQSSTILTKTNPSPWSDLIPVIKPTNIVINPLVNTYYRVRQPIGDEPGFTNAPIGSGP